MSSDGFQREEWRDVVGFEGYYQVSSMGRIFSAARIVMRKNGIEMTVAERFIKPRLNHGGYWVVTMSRDGNPTHKQVHQLVALAFIGPCPDGMEVAHGDGDSLNNCDWNLRYDTPQGNADDRVKHGRLPRGEVHPTAKLSEAQVITIRCDSRGHKNVADVHGVSESLIRMIRKGSIWKHVQVAS